MTRLFRLDKPSLGNQEIVHCVTPWYRRNNSVDMASLEPWAEVETLEVKVTCTQGVVKIKKNWWLSYLKYNIIIYAFTYLSAWW